MLKKLFTSAVFAGLAAGAIAAALTFWFIVPLILEGEMFEEGLLTHFVTTPNGSIETLAARPSLAGQLPRHLQTFGMSLVTYTGFAFLMVVGFGIAERAGKRITARIGLMWGIAGFVAVQLAPSAGLAPELPGTLAAELVARQAWWLGTVVSTILGIALIAYGRGIVLPVAGAALMLAPHLIGAPVLDVYYGIAPPELAALFSARALAVSAACWAVLGSFAGWIWSQQD